MGLPMAVNLRQKLGKGKKMVICDVNEDALERFAEIFDKEHDCGAFEVVSSAAEAINRAVSESCM